MKNDLKKVTLQCLIKQDARDSVKEDYFKNLCPKFQDGVFEICKNFTESMPSYNRMKLQEDYTVKVLFQKLMFETFLYCNKEVESGEIKVTKYMNHFMNMDTLSCLRDSWELRLPSHQQLMVKQLVSDPDSDCKVFYQNQQYSGILSTVKEIKTNF